MKKNETNAVTAKIKQRLFSIIPLFKKKYTYISSGISLHGDLIADENIVLDGRMFGNIRSTKHVSLGSTAHFDGSIESDSAVVSGYIKGSISTKHTLVVRVPATVIGDLASASVQVAPGVILNGKIITTPQPELSVRDDSREEVLAKLVEPVEGN